MSEAAFLNSHPGINEAIDLTLVLVIDDLLRGQPDLTTPRNSLAVSDVSCHGSTFSGQQCLTEAATNENAIQWLYQYIQSWISAAALLISHPRIREAAYLTSDSGSEAGL